MRQKNLFHVRSSYADGFHLKFLQNLRERYAKKKHILRKGFSVWNKGLDFKPKVGKIYPWIDTLLLVIIYF